MYNDKGDYQITEVESKRIQKKFESLRVKRENYIRAYKQAKAEQYKSTDGYEFKPRISKKSKQIVEKKLRNEQSVDNEDSRSQPRPIDRATALIQKGLEYKEKKEKLAKERQEE